MTQEMGGGLLCISGPGIIMFIIHLLLVAAVVAIGMMLLMMLGLNKFADPGNGCKLL
jgi:hypothetical protein